MNINSISENDGMETDNSDEIIEPVQNQNTVSLQHIDNSNNLQNTSNVVINELYKHTDKGPYNVIVEKQNIEKFELAIKINKLKVKRVNEINQISKNRIRVSFKNYNCDNSLVKLNDFDDLKDFNIFIPNDYVSTYGIVRNIPTYITLKEIMENVITETQIIDMVRLTWWNKEKKESVHGIFKNKF